jgi:ADP-ribose pyrophosphatase YjhB (NUDIX family)
MFKPRFCQACGGAVVEREGRFDCSSCGRRHYLNSKPTAGGVVVRDGKLLLVRREREPFKDLWDLPGGFLDAGEHPEAAVVRELREETGLEVRPTRLFGIYMDTYGDDGDATLNIYYECEVVGGREQPGDDAAALGWFGAGGIPANVAFANGRAVVEEWRRGRA